MAKNETRSGYDWIKATVTEGTVTFTYHVNELSSDGQDTHDEDVSEWTDREIQNLACDLLGIDRRFVSDVEVIRN